MLAFVLRRLFQSLIVMLAVALIAFAMFRFVGDPVNQMVGVDTPQEQVAQLRQTLGLDEPVVVQFARYIYNAARLEFGVSYQFACR
jgi:peptide/nickel transport system permease protein